MNPQNQNQPTFREVGGGGGINFKPHATEENGFQYNPNDYAKNILQGYLKGCREVSTQYGPGRVWDIHKYNTQTGQLEDVYSLFEDTFLRDRLAKIRLNAFVHIEYKGRVRRKNVPLTHAISKTNSFHSWMVGEADNMPPYAEMLKRAGLPVPGTMTPAAAPAQQGFAPPPQGFTPPAQGQPQYQQQAPAAPQAPQAPQFAPPPQTGQPQWHGAPPAQTGQPAPQFAPPPPTAAPTAPAQQPAAPQWTPPPANPPTQPPAQGGQQWTPPPTGQPAAPQAPQFAPQAPQAGQQWNPDQPPPF